ncbi:MAG: hypothetical protein ACPGZP_01585 [Panacagrimonas sp.]
MKTVIQVIALSLLVGAAAFAQAPQSSASELSTSELVRCAQQVEILRREAPPMGQRYRQLDARRNFINQRTAALRAEASSGAGSDLDAHLDFEQRNLQHRQQTIAFNAELAAYVQEVRRIEGIKREYDRVCAGRPYRRSAFQALPPHLQAAMRAGLSDIRVPYVDAGAGP